MYITPFREKFPLEFPKGQCSVSTKSSSSLNKQKFLVPLALPSPALPSATKLHGHRTERDCLNVLARTDEEISGVGLVDFLFVLGLGPFVEKI